MTQEKIAKRLKLLTVFLGVAGLLFFGLTGWNLYRAYSFTTQTGDYEASVYNAGMSHFMPILVIVITMVLCYMVLFRFYRVCNEIGKDNSFSRENVTNFEVMKVLLLVLGGVWAGYLVMYLIRSGNIELYFVSRYALFSVVFFAIAALAGALSKLIERASELREENDLTI